MDTLKEIIEKVLPTLSDEILEMKRNYFSETGKLGWNPLKPDTIKRKTKKGYPATSFNLATGALKNSLTVDARINEEGIEFTITASHERGDIALKQLIDKYGRDFLRFDDQESAWIVKRLSQLIAENSKGQIVIE